MTEFAPAKVNLTLRVGRARGDGYHPLQSLTVFADWGDEIFVESGIGLELSVEGDGAEAIGEPKSNLVLKAAYALRAAAENPDLGARLQLKKNLPIAAGLGGGSADAAACLRALNQFWDLDFSTRQLAEIGSVVGADVPACVYARPLMMSGIGETIAPLMAWPDLDAVIVNPGLPVPTGAIFDAFDQTEPIALKPEPVPALASFDAVIDRLSNSSNDLQSAAIAHTPIIQNSLDQLSQTPGSALSRMSGSGASCFALYDTAEHAAQAARDLATRNPGLVVRQVVLRGVS